MAAALVKVSGQSWGTLWDRYGNAVVGQVALLDTTIYEEDGTTEWSAAFSSDANGRLPGYVYEGDWTLTVNGTEYPAPALSGALPGRVEVLEDADDAVDAAIALLAPKASPTFTGTVSGVTKTHVGLGNVDNTSDADKPVSSAADTRFLAVESGRLRFNVRSTAFAGGAIGDRVANDTAAFLAAIAAAAAANGAQGAAVVVPAGRYLLTDELVLPHGVSLIGDDYANTSLNWSTDLGAGKYAVKWGAGVVYGAAIKNLTLNGPGYFNGTVTANTHPCAMRGPLMPSGTQLLGFLIQGFDKGAEIPSDHQILHDGNFINNFDSVYFGPSSASGDQDFETIQFTRALHAHVAVDPTAQLDGVHFTGCHFADSPHIFYAEDGVGAQQFITQGVFMDCAFEGYGNGCFYDAKRARSINVTFIGCAEGSGFAAAQIPGDPANACIDCYAVQMVTDGGFPLGMGAEAIVKSLSVFKGRWENAHGAIAAARSTGRAVVKAVTPQGATGTYLDTEFEFLRADGTAPLIATSELVELVNTYQCERTSASSFVVGIALHSDPGTGSTSMIPVATRGYAPIKTAATIAAHKYVKLDTATPGNVVEANGAADNAIGYTVEASSGGVVNTRLIGTARGGLATVVESVNVVAASGTAQTLPDVSTATIHRVTLTDNCTFTFPTIAAGKSFTVVLLQDATGSRLATWPAVLWPGGSPPTLTTTAAKRDVLTFVCADGSNWLGFVSGQNL